MGLEEDNVEGKIPHPPLHPYIFFIFIILKIFSCVPLLSGCQDMLLAHHGTTCIASLDLLNHIFHL